MNTAIPFLDIKNKANVTGHLFEVDYILRVETTMNDGPYD